MINITLPRALGQWKVEWVEIPAIQVPLAGAKGRNTPRTREHRRHWPRTVVNAYPSFGKNRVWVRRLKRVSEAA
jgi:hypothetical protein